MWSVVISVVPRGEDLGLGNEMRIGKAAAGSKSSTTTKLVFICVALLGGFLLVDLLWASSSSSSSSFNWPLPTSNVLVFPNQTLPKVNQLRILHSFVFPSTILSILIIIRRRKTEMPVPRGYYQLLLRICQPRN